MIYQTFAFTVTSETKTCWILTQYSCSNISVFREFDFFNIEETKSDGHCSLIFNA